MNKNKDIKKANGINKSDNYAITFKIDADIEDYLRNIMWIKFIESRETTNMNEYVNNLIRKEMCKLLEINENSKQETIKSKWYEYKRKNSL